MIPIIGWGVIVLITLRIVQAQLIGSAGRHERAATIVTGTSIVVCVVFVLWLLMQSSGTP